MNVLKVAIKNYEAIEGLQIAFVPGLHAITGASNNGKSSIFRAIYALLYNKHSDNAIQQGKDSYIIGVEYGDNKVLCKRNQNQAMKTSYQVNGKNITKVGRNGVDEVDEALNMAIVDLAGTKVELNITEQFAYPFLLDMTPGKLYTFLSQASTHEDFNKVLKEMRNDLKEIDDKRKRLEGAVEVAKNTFEEVLVVYDNVKDSDTITTEILNMNSEITYATKLESICNRLSICDSELLASDKALTSIRKQLDILAPLEALRKEVDSLDLLRNHMSKIKQTLLKHKDVNQTYGILCNMITKLDFSIIEMSLNDINHLETFITKLGTKIEALNNRFKALDLYEQDFNRVINQIKDTDTLDSIYKGYNTLQDFVCKLETKITKIDKLDNELVNTSASIQDIDKELTKINKNLSEYKVCPVCGHEL